MISPKSIEIVKETARVEEVLGEFIDLRRAGVNMKGVCPFHDEKTPSFVVSPAKGIYKCFGCGMAGDSVRFLMDHEKLSYPEAIRWIAEKYNIELEETAVSDDVKKEIEKKESLFIINEFARKLYHEHMMETREGKAIGLGYFKERGFLEKTINQWGLGYSPDGRHFLKTELKKNGYNLDLAQEIGLLKPDKDFFRSRIIFPIRNLSGKVIGFGARTLSSDKKIPKYLNSPESEIYNKRKTLFGLYFSKTEIRKKDNCFLVEGYTDVLSLHQNGIENAVASSGTSLTVDQIKLIKRFTENMTVLFDGDNAGIKAALRGLDLILEQDVNVRLVLLPEGEDPDSYVRKVGATAFNQYIEDEAKDFILFKVDLLLKEAGNDPIKRSKVVKDIVFSVSKIADPLKRNEYVKLCSKLLDISEKIINNEINGLIKNNIQKEIAKANRPVFRSEEEWKDKPQNPVQEKVKTYDSESDEAQERDIVRIIITMGDKLVDENENIFVADYIYSNIVGIIETFEDSLYADIVTEVRVAFENGKTVSPNYFLHHHREDIQRLAIDVSAEKYIYANWKERGIELQTQDMPENNHIKDSWQAILRLKSRKLQKILKLTESKISEAAEANNADLDIQIKAYMKLKEDLAQINKILGTVVLK